MDDLIESDPPAQYTIEESVIAPLWGHQIEAIEAAKGLHNYALFHEPGCMAWHTEIRTSRCGAGRVHTIESLFRLFNGVELSPSEKGFDNKFPTYIRAWDGSRIKLHKIKAVNRSGEKAVYKLSTTERYLGITITADHEVLTKRGWVAAGELILGVDEVAVDLQKKHQKKQIKTRKEKTRYLAMRVGQFHPYARKKTRSTYGVTEKYRIVDTHRLVYEAKANRVSLDTLISNTRHSNSLIFINPKHFHIHHKDGNPRNNDISNLECLTEKEHRTLHGKEHGFRNFGHGQITWHTVTDFKYVGKEMTYDIVCEEPHRNFVANNIVIHNCGKSRTAIEILKHKFGEKITQNILILGPIIIVEQWKREWEKFSKFNPNLIVALGGNLTGLQKAKAMVKIGYTDTKQIVITNYDSLYNKEVFRHLKEFIKDGVLVCDESSRLKNPKARRTKLCTELADAAESRYILSGTPVLNSQLDIFSQFRILDGGKTFGKNFFAFRARFFVDKNAGWKGSHNYFPDFVPKASANAEIRELIRPISSRVTKEEAMDLPSLIRKEVFVELSREERKQYNQMKESLITFLNDKACVAQMALTKCIRLQQMVSGFMHFDDGTEKSFPEFAKISALRDLLEDIAPNHKVIVWCIYKRNYEDIKKVCAELCLGVSELHGGVLNKDDEVQRFQSDSTCRVMIANPSAGGLGVNLTSASYSIFYSRSFSLEHDIQAESRNHRGGSLEAGHKKITRIDLIAKDSIDEIVLQAIKNKLSTSNDILNLLRQKIR